MEINYKVIRNFLVKELKWSLNLYSIEDYLKRQGYAVIFYNTANGDKILESLGLTGYAGGCNAFTYKRSDIKMVFTDMRLSAENKLYSLLHETAHIYLGHLEENEAFRDENMNEIQADTFAYNVVKYSKYHEISRICVKVLIPIVAVLTAVSCVMYTKPVSVNTVEETVYVTEYGKKYHSETCVYAQDKEKCTAIAKSEAEKVYEPCKVCMP